jgi:hypothetical protein
MGAPGPGAEMPVILASVPSGYLFFDPWTSMKIEPVESAKNSNPQSGSEYVTTPRI